MRIERKRAPAVLALGLLASGCAWNQQAADERAGPSLETRLEVSSLHWDDVRVYAVGTNGARVRLGLVGSMETRVFRLPADIVAPDGSVRLIANPLAAPEPHRTDHILLRPGDMVEWLIENPLALSSYAVRGGVR